MTTKTGNLKCSMCGSDVVVSSRLYGGMLRWICTMQTCANSEIAWDMEI